MMSECNHTVSYLDKTAHKVHTYQVDAIDCPHCLRVMLENTAVEIERLRAVVDKLPRTADGVPVVPGLDTVWITWSEEAKQTLCTWRLMHLRGHRCYSTREAAEAAGGKR